jgi:serine phosphatase RsbU (regulator of sigma subunit)
MTDTQSTVKVLKTIPILRGLSGATYAALARRTRALSFKAGKPIFREGAQGTTLYIVKEGEVDIVKGSGKNAVTLVTRRPGEFFGEMGILESAQRSATARARTDVTLLEVPGDVVVKTLLKNPRVLLGTTRMLSSNLRQADTAMIARLKKKNAELERAYKALQAAQAEIIEKKRLERELELARELQDSLLPRETPPIGEFRFAGRSRPSAAVGGDFYDVIPIGPNFVGLLMASVAGTGLFAAIFMALTRALVVSESRRQVSPKAVAERVHQLLLQLAKPTMPVSMFYGVIDVRNRALAYVNAGHAAPLLRDADGRVEALAGSGTQLAASPRVSVDEQSIVLQPGQALVMFSDGLIETRNGSDTKYGLGRMRATLAGAFESPSALVERFFADADAHRGATAQSHDQAILIASVST